jgi:RecB family exonuclease
VHAALRDWWLEPPERRTPEQGAALLRRSWIDAGFRDEAMSRRWQGRSAQLVRDYLEHVDPADEPAGVERTVSTVSGPMVLEGRVDRIDRRASPDDGTLDELVVVDYKTGRRPPGVDEARSSLALAVYAVASARVLRRPCHQVELHHLPSATTVAWRHDQLSLDRHVRRVGSIAADVMAAEAAWREGLSDVAAREGRSDGTGVVSDAAAAAEVDEVFPASPSGLCGWCDARRWCAVGQETAAAKRPWDGVEPDDAVPAGPGALEPVPR